MVEAFKFRDLLAHGKSVVDEEFSGKYVLYGPDRDDYLDPEWLREFRSLERTKTVLEDMESALRELQTAAGLTSEPLGLVAEGDAEGPSSP